jgi:hypothetical protein
MDEPQFRGSEIEAILALNLIDCPPPRLRFHSSPPDWLFWLPRPALDRCPAGMRVP